MAGIFDLMKEGRFKGRLFMGVGIMDEETGRGDMGKVGGVMGIMGIRFRIWLIGRF